MNSDFLNPYISISVQGTMFEYEECFGIRGWFLRDVYLLVLFLELAHIVLILNDFASHLDTLDDEVAVYELETEQNCNYIARKVFKRQLCTEKEVGNKGGGLWRRMSLILRISTLKWKKELWPKYQRKYSNCKKKR
ncbi:MAG: hypothetical protein O2U61_01925 [Candidatus Bathyarchaeota archaeon]|nr:hypothetical protein [Candidatus Bathyarchaeota archaeon]